MRRLPRLLLPLVAAGALGCAPPREATVPLTPADALGRAVRILESFEYNVVVLDREKGFVRGTRAAESLSPRTTGMDTRTPAPGAEVIWEVTIHVSPLEDGSHYRLESDALRGRGGVERVDPSHLDRILRALADWSHWQPGGTSGAPTPY